MTEQEVIDLMERSKSANEWNDHCDKVKRACGGYPTFWWATIIKSGRADQIMARWGGSSGMTISSVS